jgi:sugar/nucleoside kinase (ribokinase family)
MTEEKTNNKNLEENLNRETENNSDTERLDFVGIGDAVTDTFIELIDAWIEDDNPEETKELCMRFGDKIPYSKEVTIKGTGNALNATNAANKLGLKTGIITDIGADENGQAIIDAFNEKGIDTTNITKHDDTETNHNFILRFKAERTILVQHYEYDYTFPEYPEGMGPKWFYLSSLAKNSIEQHHRIAKFLETHPETKLAFQPGTFQIKLGAEELADLYRVSEIFFCNKEEAQKILKTKEVNMKELLKKMRELGPKIVAISDGPDGAYVYDGQEFWHGPMYPDPAPPVDRTGAGDSFSATFTVALAKGKSIEEALMWGPINSMSVVQFVGAQEGHLTEEQILEYLKNKPKDYQPNKF